ncbi:PspC domain-containing protein [Pontibacter sp. KCTC 32443]|uniref:PspC domain-containing protein n=1 Tax=Pontibacter TaxID=323449 RepID=UPI00164CF48E|nr:MULTISPECIES: PspC domain-containing protein [Pontibacter]MBC5775046.1 PspC domain-containing protein [Pontibacter sp. KCTC 32443]
MKKNISINLQGIIFYIEEDGYEQLSRYLASVRSYFSNYEGHEEIVADIELRIAEIFSARLSPAKQVITQEDVQYLIARMGNVTEFEVMDPVEEEIPNYGTGGAATASAAYAAPGTKKLYRDVNRKVISGVCAGIANYLNLDVVWVRLFFILFLVLGILSAGISAAAAVILYIVLWIAMPESHELPDTTVKKLFRDPEDKKLGGVASGIAKYFGVDVAVVRILFLVSIFLGGFGLILYIVLWIAVPEAVTLTERMQMQGSPVTLAGIEHTLKENLNMKDQNGQESTLAKVILLPIRLISQIITWMGRALGPILAFLVVLIRVAAGIFLLLVSVGLTVGLFSAFFASMGWLDNTDMIQMGPFSSSIWLGGFPRFGLVAGLVVGLIPLLFLIMLAIGLLAKRFFMRPTVGWSLFGVWIAALIIMIASIISYSANFQRSGEIEITKTIPAAGVRVLDAYDLDLEYNNLYIDVREHAGPNIEVIQQIEAKGRTEAEAKQNARMVTYRVVQQDSTLRFDNSYEFKEGARFRDQDLTIVLRLPKNKPFRLTREFVYLLPSATFDQDYGYDKIERNTWQVKGDMLECLTCATDTLDTEDTETDFNVDADFEDFGNNESVLLDMQDYGSNSKAFQVSDFERISISGPYHVQIKEGKTHKVTVRGPEREIRRMEVDTNSGELTIESEDNVINLFENHDPVLIQITVPELESLHLGGAIKADVTGINANELYLGLAGATKAAINVRAKTLRADVAGASNTLFTGTTDKFELEAAGACKIDADQLRASDVVVEALGATKADVYATGSLRAEASGASRITYKGNPRSTQIDADGASKVSRQ